MGERIWRIKGYGLIFNLVFYLSDSVPHDLDSGLGLGLGSNGLGLRLIKKQLNLDSDSAVA